MLSLVDKGVVRRKEFGKKKKEIYYVDLDVAAKHLGDGDGAVVASEEERRVGKLELQRCGVREVGLQREMKSVLQELSNEELAKRLGEEEATVEGLRDRVASANGRIGNSQDEDTSRKRNKFKKPMSAFGAKRGLEECNMTSKEIKVRFNFMRTEWKGRKEKCNDFIDNLADAMEKKLKDVHKTLDIVTDQMEGVTLPLKKVVD